MRNSILKPLPIGLILMIVGILLSGTGCSVVEDPGVPDTGQTIVAEWKDNKSGALTLAFDDSSTSQADIALPAMIQRGLVGSWYINPGHRRYFDPSYDACTYNIPDCPYVCKDSRVTAWEVDALGSGQELANHTWDHSGWTDCAGADYQIGECARYIWALSGKANSLLTFEPPGGVTTTCGTLGQILAKYHCVARGDTISGGPAAEMIAIAQQAIDDNEWRVVLYHHVDGVTGFEPVPCGEFLQFLDWLVAKKNELWIATYIDAYKYSQERDTAEITVLESTDHLIRLNLTAAKDPLLFDLPLTLITDVPKYWGHCLVRQGGEMRIYPIAVRGKAQYEATPNKGEIRLSGI